MSNKCLIAGTQYDAWNIRDKSKGKFQSFVNFTRKTNDNDFPSLTFYENSL